MKTLIDTSVWIELARARSSVQLKRLSASFIVDESAHLAEPVIFELLRNVSDLDFKATTSQLETFPILETPENLWERAAVLGRRCRKVGYTAGAIDLLIASIAQAHKATIITLDEGFAKIAESGQLQVKLLRRPEVS